MHLLPRKQLNRLSKRLTTTTARSRSRSRRLVFQVSLVILNPGLRHSNLRIWICLQHRIHSPRLNFLIRLRIWVGVTLCLRILLLIRVISIINLPLLKLPREYMSFHHHSLLLLHRLLRRPLLQLLYQPQLLQLQYTVAVAVVAVVAHRIGTQTISLLHRRRNMHAGRYRH